MKARFNRTDRQRVARECLRQLWGIMDRGGHSMGRSIDSTFLELAMKLLPSKDERARLLSKRADEDPIGFLHLARDIGFEVGREEQAAHDKEQGYKSVRSPWRPTWESIDAFIAGTGGQQIVARSGQTLASPGFNAD